MPIPPPCMPMQKQGQLTPQPLHRFVATSAKKPCHPSTFESFGFSKRGGSQPLFFDPSQAGGRTHGRPCLEAVPHLIWDGNSLLGGGSPCCGRRITTRIAALMSYTSANPQLPNFSDGGRRVTDARRGATSTPQPEPLRVCGGALAASCGSRLAVPCPTPCSSVIDSPAYASPFVSATRPRAEGQRSRDRRRPEAEARP
jgi:hypothetical protein